MLGGVLYLVRQPNLSWLYLIAGWLLYMGLSLPWTARRRIRGFWNRHPFVAEPVQAWLDENGFGFETYSGRTQLRWHTFSHWMETAELFLIFRGPMMCHYLPKRAMTNQIEECRNMLRQFIGRTKYEPPEHGFAVMPVSEAA